MSMSALPKSLAKLNVDVKVILPRYKCIPQKFQGKDGIRGVSFDMNLCSDRKAVLWWELWNIRRMGLSMIL